MYTYIGAIWLTVLESLMAKETVFWWPLGSIRIRQCRMRQPLKPLRRLRPLKPLPLRRLRPLKPLQRLRPLKPLKRLRPLKPLKRLRPLKPLPLKPLSQKSLLPSQMRCLNPLPFSEGTTTGMGLGLSRLLYRSKPWIHYALQM